MPDTLGFVTVPRLALMTLRAEFVSGDWRFHGSIHAPWAHSLWVILKRARCRMGWHTFEKAEIDYMSTRCPYCGSVKQRASMVVHIGGGR